MSILKKTIGLVMVLMLTIAIASTTTGCDKDVPLSNKLNLDIREVTALEFVSSDPYARIPPEINFYLWKIYTSPNCARAYYRNNDFEELDSTVFSQVEFYDNEKKDSALGWIDVYSDYYKDGFTTIFNGDDMERPKYVKPLKTPEGYVLSHAFTSSELVIHQYPNDDGTAAHELVMASVLNLIYDKADQSWEGFEENKTKKLVPIMYQDFDIDQHSIESESGEVAIPIEVQFQNTLPDTEKQFYIGLVINDKLVQTVKASGDERKKIRNFGFYPILSTNYREECDNVATNRRVMPNGTYLTLREVSLKFFDLDGKELVGQDLKNFCKEAGLDDPKGVKISHSDILPNINSTQKNTDKVESLYFKEEYEKFNFEVKALFDH